MNHHQLENKMKKTIELDPSNVSAFAMLGGVYGAQGRVDAAKQKLDAWVAKQPRSVAARTMAAMLLVSPALHCSAAWRVSRPVDGRFLAGPPPR